MGNPDEVIAALDSLLDLERDAALTGDLDAIEGLVRRKEALLDELGGIEAVEGDQLRRVESKARRNQTLLDGTLEGIRVVASRFAALRRTERAFVTYDMSGRKREDELAPTRSVERRS